MQLIQLVQLCNAFSFADHQLAHRVTIVGCLRELTNSMPLLTRILLGEGVVQSNC